MTVSEALSYARKSLEGSPTPLIDARALLKKASGFSKEAMAAHPEWLLPSQEEGLFLSFVLRRAQGEPVAYIVGEKEFWEGVFYVDRRVLIPRPETELLVEESLAFLQGRGHANFLDLCCGSGCVGLSVASALPFCRVALSDMSGDALEVARMNARQAGIDAEFYHSDLFSGIPENAVFHAIAANPPYIPSGEIAELARDVREYEPRLALDGGGDGLSIARRIIQQAPSRLAPGGLIVLEVGAGQAQEALGLLSKSFEDVRAVRDLSGIERAVRGIRKG
jgi:release factor glutamine methyltransferase